MNTPTKRCEWPYFITKIILTGKKVPAKKEAKEPQNEDEEARKEAGQRRIEQLRAQLADAEAQQRMGKWTHLLSAVYDLSLLLKLF